MGEILFLIVLFAVGGLLQAAGRRRRQADPRGTAYSPSEPEPAAAQGGMLAEIQKALEEMKRANEAASFENEDAEEEEAVTRETAPEVRSMDDLVPRAERVVVDQDDAIEALAAQRAGWAEARSRPLTNADHRAFDATIRAAEPTPTVGSDRAAALRRLVIWQEILGKPVSLRDRE